MGTEHYAFATICDAFWATFHEQGVRQLFPYLGTPEQNASATQSTWEHFAENLAKAHQARLAPAIAAIRALSDVNGHLHIVLDDENYEDGHVRYCETLHEQNDLEMSAEHLTDEKACFVALWPLTALERQWANEQYEAEALEAFYQKYPERRPA